MASLFNKDIRELKGVGEKRARLYQKLGVANVGALLRFYPRSYEDWSQVTGIMEAPIGDICVIQATVLDKPKEYRIRKGMTLYKTRATDGHSDILLTYFNNPYIVNLLQEGQSYRFRGKISGTLLRKEMNSPEFSPAQTAAPILPVYRKTEGLSDKMIQTAVHGALAMLPDIPHDPIPDMLRQQYHLCHLRFALEHIHFPASMEDLKTARKRLVFEEFLMLQLGLSQLKSRGRTENHYMLEQDDPEPFFSLLPFTPTSAQRRAVMEALSDMAGGTPMNRLVQGDVGSGKTAVAAALCYCVIQNGMQAALMAPTEILAQQHYRSLKTLLAPAGIVPVLLTGSLPAAQKKAIARQLETGEAKFVIGTHALLSEHIVFHRLALVVTDEQHRFGVAQRAALAEKGNHPHLLVMSATPIPRTLALMIYGDLDLSILDELPPGRQAIETYAIQSDKRPRAFRYLQKHIDMGQQCYIICPLIEEGKSDMTSVMQYTADLRKNWFSKARIGTLHGRMKPAEKEAVMREFAEGNLDILVSTTVVEVGVDVPNATVMLIENAERYGLSQLHQLRGRVGRGSALSTCILVSDAQNEAAIRRLQVMCRTNDGFQIADEDLKLRGPGDFFGQKQHGLPDLKIADMMNDIGVLKQAQTAAHEILQKDPDLSLPEHSVLRAQTRQLFAQIGESGLN